MAELNVKSAKQRLRRAAESLTLRVVGGGRARERMLIELLGLHYKARVRRAWQLSDEEPHYSDHNAGIFNFAYSDGGIGAAPFQRGFYSTEVLRDSDVVLDIGCGDGFFSRRFLAPRCSHVDAIDIEESAIDEARHIQPPGNVTWHLGDAVKSPFPRPRYDVIVWDGALGHFAPETTTAMMQKIAGALTEDGLFVGSESLGREGSDHLQFFDNDAELARVFKPHFKYVEVRTMKYWIDPRKSFLREEAYWRCSNSPARLDAMRWQRY